MVVIVLGVIKDIIAIIASVTSIVLVTKTLKLNNSKQQKQHIHIITNKSRKRPLRRTGIRKKRR